MRTGILMTLAIWGACNPAAKPSEGSVAAGSVAPATTVSRHLTWTRDWTTLIVKEDGSAEYDFHPSGWGSEGATPAHVQWKVPPADLQTLLETLSDQSVCKLHGSGRSPVPEEHNATLELAFPGLQCTVSMLENDWKPSVTGPLDSLAARGAQQGGADAGKP
jgi:hypothetical protein